MPACSCLTLFPLRSTTSGKRTSNSFIKAAISPLVTLPGMTNVHLTSGCSSYNEFSKGIYFWEIGHSHARNTFTSVVGSAGSQDSIIKNSQVTPQFTWFPFMEYLFLRTTKFVVAISIQHCFVFSQLGMLLPHRCQSRILRYN